MCNIWKFFVCVCLACVSSCSDVSVHGRNKLMMRQSWYQRPLSCFCGQWSFQWKRTVYAAYINKYSGNIMIDDNFSFQNTSKMVEWLSPLLKLLLVFDDKVSPHKKKVKTILILLLNKINKSVCNSFLLWISLSSAKHIKEGSTHALWECLCMHESGC